MQWRELQIVFSSTISLSHVHPYSFKDSSTRNKAIYDKLTQNKAIKMNQVQFTSRSWFTYHGIGVWDFILGIWSQMESTQSRSIVSYYRSAFNINNFNFFISFIYLFTMKSNHVFVGDGIYFVTSCHVLKLIFKNRYMSPSTRGTL